MKLYDIVSYRLDGSLYNVRDIVPSKPRKFGAVIFPCHFVITGVYTGLYFRKSAELVKVAALVCL